MITDNDSILPQAVNCGMFCFWRRQSVFLLVYKISRGTTERICAKFTRKTCLVPRSDEFEGQGQTSTVKVISNKTSGCATWFTAGDAIRIGHYDDIDDVITRKL